MTDQEDQNTSCRGCQYPEEADYDEHGPSSHLALLITKQLGTVEETTVGMCMLKEYLKPCETTMECKSMHSPGPEVWYSYTVEDIAEHLEQHHKEEPHVRQRAVFPVCVRGERGGGGEGGRGERGGR